MVLASDVDLLDPPAQLEKRKVKRVVHDRLSPWMDVVCENCLKPQTVLRRSQDVVKCVCGVVLCQPPPTGGHAKPTVFCTVLGPRPWLKKKP